MVFHAAFYPIESGFHHLIIIRSTLAGVTSIEDLEAVAAPLKTATKTLAARAAEAGLDTAAMGILDGSKFIPLDALVDEKVQFAIFIQR